MLTPNVTGGLFWHWQAWRSHLGWKPTVEALEVWLKLQTKNTRSDALVIIGASAGWMMPIGWLCQFKEVHTFDIDPLAAPLFRWRHGKKLRSVGTALTCHTQNALSDLPSLLKAHPHACIFFDNVLGQLRFTESGVQLAEKNISTYFLGARTPLEALNGVITRSAPPAIFLWAQLPHNGDPRFYTDIPAIRPAPRVIIGGPGWGIGSDCPVAHVTDLSQACAEIERAVGL
jgi:hypothetical protein